MSSRNNSNFGPNYATEQDNATVNGSLCSGSKGHFGYRQLARNNSYHESRSLPGDPIVDDNDSNSSSRTLGSSQESATLTSSDTDDPNWKQAGDGGCGGKSSGSKRRSKSEAPLSGDNRNHPPVRLRSHSHLQQLREHRTSADVYLLEDAARNVPRYTPSASPKQQYGVPGGQYGAAYYGGDPLSNSLYSNIYAAHLQEKSLSHLANYQMMQPSAPYHQRSSNYANMCPRLGCEHCTLPGYMPCHSSFLYEQQMGLTSAPFWDYAAATGMPNAILLANHPLLTGSANHGHPLTSNRKVHLILHLKSLPLSATRRLALELTTVGIPKWLPLISQMP